MTSSLEEPAPGARTPGYLKIGWGLLLLWGLFPLFAVVSDLAADFGSGIPSDHTTTFAKLAGMTWAAAQQSARGTTHYITLLEKGYAVHELVFALLFLAIVAIPFRRGERWAWWACWSLLIATAVYSLTFGRYDSGVLAQSLYANIALVVLLVIQVRRFYFAEPGRGAAGGAGLTA